MLLKRFVKRQTHVRSDYRNPSDEDKTVAANLAVTLDSTQAKEIDGNTWMAVTEPLAGWIRLDMTSDQKNRTDIVESKVAHAARFDLSHAVHWLGNVWRSLTNPRPGDGPLKATGRRVIHSGGKLSVRGLGLYGLLTAIARVAGESPAFEAWLHAILRPLLPYLALLGGLIGPIVDPAIPDSGPVLPEPTPTAEVGATGTDIEPDMIITDGFETATVAAGWNVHACPTLECDVMFTTATPHTVRILARQGDFRLIQGDGQDGTVDIGWVVSDALNDASETSPDA